MRCLLQVTPGRVCERSICFPAVGADVTGIARFKLVYESRLQVAPVALLRALTTRTMSLNHEKDILKNTDAREATESRDALAKTLYANLFDWLVSAINRKIPSYGRSSPPGVPSNILHKKNLM